MPEHARAAPLHGLRSQRKIPHIGSLCFRKDAVKKQKKYSQTKAIGPTPHMGLEKLAQNISHFLQSSGRVKKEKKKVEACDSKVSCENPVVCSQIRFPK